MCGIFTYLGTSVSSDKLKEGFSTLQHRGPDQSNIRMFDGLFLGFHRLSIMDLSESGMQPFESDDGTDIIACNGEIYNYKQLKSQVSEEYAFQSGSDCEVLLPLIASMGISQLAPLLDAEFAMIHYNTKTKKLMAARDPIGIRPLFYGYTKVEGEIAFASEAKALIDFCEIVKPFPPGHYYDGDGKFIQFRSMTGQVSRVDQSFEDALEGIKVKLTAAVEKRVQADAPLGYLLSGGLDSSLVCALGAKLTDKPIKTFAVGCRKDAIDIKYAEQVAKHIGADHTNVMFTMDEVFSALKEVIRTLETWDITTIRASVGMYLVCKYIGEQTPIKVLLSGEVSDELFGYKYTDFAPNGFEFQMEACKRIHELHYYDVLRADRCISAHSLEARVPFGDLDFVDHVMSIDPKVKMNQYDVGKYLLRKAFDDGKLLPHDILFREKAAFSDAVGHSVVDEIKAYAASRISDIALEQASYKHGQPFTKESLFYRQIFESFYPGRAELIPSFWMPNSEWSNCDVKDPSARALPNYGASGL